MPTQKLTAEIITAAIEGFQSQKRRIDDQIAELRFMLPGGPAEPTAAALGPPTRKRKVSAAARKRMALAQKARWAKIRGESEPPAPAIIAATRKRWRLQRAAAKPQSTPKKAAVKKVAAKKAAKSMRQKESLPVKAV